MSEGGRTARTFWADASGDGALDAYRTFADTIDEGLCQLDADGRFVAVNDVLVDRLGYSRKDLIGTHLSELVVDDARERVSEALQERHASPDDDAVILEVDARQADGDRLPVELRLNTLADAGEGTGFVGVVTVRERHRPEPEPELSEIMDRISDGFFALDENWEFTHVNEPAHDLINPEGGELVGKNVWEEFPAATERKFKEYYERAMEEQVTVSFEEYYPDPLNTWFEVNAYPSETGLSVYFQDVTDRKEREQRFEQYETIIETMNDGIYVKDPDGRFTMVNEAYAEMTGYSRDELVGAHASLVVDESAVTESRERIETADENPPTMEAAIETADGESLPAEATFSMVHTDDVRLEVGVVRDISERKEYERRLEMRAHQQSVVAELGKYALEVDHLDELMKVASQRVANVLDNEYCKVLDLDDEERHLLLRQGVGWRDGIVGSATVDADDNSQAGYTLLSKEPVVVEDLATETRFSGPDLLTSHDVQSGISTIIGSFDDPWGILGTHDTASRTFSEEDVAFVQAVANILAEAIERDRYNTELERTIRELEASNERLEQFAYAASHDLQEPLRMVSSYLSLIERRYEDDLDEDGLEFIEYAVDGAERMRDMIDALLTYSRVETRGDPFEQVDLDTLVDSVRADYRMKIQETDATITTTDLPTVYGDEDQLRQVFGNLISNALEYNGGEPPTIRVFAEHEGDRWIVGVEDDGIGIDPDHEDRVFDVFQRLHTQEEYGGTGIGLALAQRIVERHDGDIWVESEPGEGSTFYCSLPVVDQTNDSSP